MGASISGMTGTAGFAAWTCLKPPMNTESRILKFMKTGGRFLMYTAIPLAGVMGFLSRGSSELFPSFAIRAQKHVDAGAEMTKIHRRAKLYRSQLQAVAPGNYLWLTGE